MERIRIYLVGFDISTWDILLVGRLQQPAPLIEYLDVNHMHYRTPDSFIFPSSHFAGDTTLLKQLDMTQFLVDFQAPCSSLFNCSIGALTHQLHRHRWNGWKISPISLHLLVCLFNSMRSQGNSTRVQASRTFAFVYTEFGC